MEKENKKFREITEEEKERIREEEFERDLLKRIEFENAFSEMLREFYDGTDNDKEQELK